MAEAAGIALAGIPIVVNLLQGYVVAMKAYRRWQKYGDILKDVIWRLNMEKLKLRNTCSELLILSGNVYDAALFNKNPKGNLWQKPLLQESLNAWLGPSCRAFFGAMSNIGAVIQEFENKLGIVPKMEPTWNLKNRHKEEWKRLRLSLSGDLMEALIRRLRMDNQDVADLVGHSRRMDALRIPNQAANAREYKRIQDQARNLYHVLKHKFTSPCDCIIHTANLCLEAESDSKRELQFHISFAFKSAQDQNPPEPCKDWRETRIKPLGSSRARAVDVIDPQTESAMSSRSTTTAKANTSAIVAATGLSLAALGGHEGIRSFSGQQTTPAQSATNSTSCFLPVRLKKVSFAMPDPMPMPISSQKNHESQLSDNDSVSESEIIGELCQAMRDSREASYLGILVDEEGRGHRISMLKAPPNNEPMQIVSLQSLLEEIPLERMDRLVLGVKLASTLLRLHSTPWLNTNLEKQNVFFKKQGKGIETALLDKPLLSKDFIAPNCRISSPEPDNAALSRGLQHHTRNQSIFALGVLLIELWFGKPLDQLRDAEDLGPQNQVNDITDFATTSRLVETVYKEAGSCYGEAVSRCISCEFEQRSSNLDTESFKQAVHSGVISQLEKNLDFFCGGNLREVLGWSNDVDDSSDFSAKYI